MRSETVGSSGERPTVNEAVEGFSVFLARRISHSACAIQILNYVFYFCNEVFDENILHICPTLSQGLKIMSNRGQ
jgi:hypothetical protein